MLIAPRKFRRMRSRPNQPRLRLRRDSFFLHRQCNRIENLFPSLRSCSNSSSFNSCSCNLPSSHNLHLSEVPMHCSIFNNCNNNYNNNNNCFSFNNRRRVEMLAMQQIFTCCNNICSSNCRCSCSREVRSLLGT
mmetsp:Transcript_4049/g.14992  ORF Transcript_4049/g.14992 Transcript_4049/m.14992 type:complete len:134 (-) Transcript_4049:339-740(-)